MYKPFTFIVLALLCSIPSTTFSQSDFSLDDYHQFVEDNRDLESDVLLSRYAAPDAYYQKIADGTAIEEFAYLPVIQAAYNLTEAELTLLHNNQFVVSERLSHESFGQALYDIYYKDLPVFVTTDAILQAIHASYDKLLMEMEINTLKPKLEIVLDGLYASYPQLYAKYQANPRLRDALEDVDLYVTIAISLLAEVQMKPQLISSDKLETVWNAVLSEKLVYLPLFMNTPRPIDFSQFTVRGHYTIEQPDGTQPLASYFRCMMWLGRIDFILSNPPVEWGLSREDVRRMNLGALLLNELINMNPAKSLGAEIDEIITTLVGESDNLTPNELANIEQNLNILNADALVDDAVFDAFQLELKASSASGQKILSLLIRGQDEPNSDPVELPISFMLFGQRFIIDSYIFSSVVYDRIVYNGYKVCRLMPNPLDAMFALGNDDALPLLADELDTYRYSAQLAALRYLIDAYDADFWDKSLYNAWLQSIRCLNQAAKRDGSPLFMHTTAWHQQKLNTQLASWTQLRHDNLLYAKQSYTGIPICSFPHSFVEPYPAFFHQIAAFAEKADQVFYQVTADENIRQYFVRLKEVMFKLEIIAQKEIDRQALNSEEIKFLQDMLFVSDGPCGEPPFWGWYADLFYDPIKGGANVANERDFLVADVHTQPADCAGMIVGRVLHVGVGKINLGVFLADSPSNDFKPMAYVGPVMSYYEKITSDFERLTDEQWEVFVESGDVPARPDWVNLYLADQGGNARAAGRELPGIIYTGANERHDKRPENYYLAQNYPNPFNPSTVIEYGLPQSGHVRLLLYDLQGRLVRILADAHQAEGHYSIVWNGTDDSGIPVTAGVYYYRIQVNEFIKVSKLVLIK